MYVYTLRIYVASSLLKHSLFQTPASEPVLLKKNKQT